MVQLFFSVQLDIGISQDGFSFFLGVILDLCILLIPLNTEPLHAWDAAANSIYLVTCMKDKVVEPC